MYKVTINNRQFNVDLEHSPAQVDGKPFVADLVECKKGRFHLLRDNRSYTAEVIQANRDEKTFLIKVDNAVFSLSVSDRFDALLKEMGIDGAAAQKVNDLKAPMPGLVLNVMVQEGQPITKGEPILVLEAMKMENIIKAPADGNVRKVAVSKGDKVEKNQVMITLG
jgi:biotin carboxyl carrier protein